jgi:hypothetical protein
MPSSLDRVGFQNPVSRAQKKRRLAFAELIMTLALALSIAVAATAVSIGIARADTFAAAPIDDSPYAVAALLGVVIAGMGGLTAMTAMDSARGRRRD